MTGNLSPLPEPTWNGTAGTIRQFIRNFTWLCKRHNLPIDYYVQDVLNYIPAPHFEIWESVARDHPIWDDFVKSILRYYPQPSLADSSGNLGALISRFNEHPSHTIQRDNFFSYLRQFTFALSAIEQHRTVPKSEKVSKFFEGLAPIIRGLIDKHNPKDMNEVIAASNPVYDYLGLLDSQTTRLFGQLVYLNLEACQRSVIVQGYNPLSSANRDEPGLTVVSHGQTDT
ncbi:hypothetical protein FA15DRAFT_673103 [Coprinopsis marcescibilis]|uniref:Uncharacterized protein n=1 Tax=Coprinopsis marcescibilis TaxID=230819 RepID=A0A5C3KLN9_COPMA|nr:hypothetical protein FA15DRAFT_673103 [Coprinopsis marcescibilis]